MRLKVEGKKQIVYSGLVIRLFSTIIDLLILSIISRPLASGLSSFNNYFFADYKFNYDASDSYFMVLFNNPEFFSFLLFSLILQIIFMAVFFIGFWHYKSATPGKMLLGMKITTTDFNKPSLFQFIKRFLGLAFALVGIWFISFSKNKQALHDKLADTIVIKK